MDRSLLLRHLAEAEKHVALGEENVRRQREIVAQLDRDGLDSVKAKELLEQFESVQAMHIADRDRVAEELAESHN